MDLLTIYDFGVKFLEKHPQWAEFHRQLKQKIIQCHTKESLDRLCQARRQNKSDDRIKCTIAIQFCVAIFLFISGMFDFIFHWNIFGFFFNELFAVILYWLGVLNLESLTYSPVSGYTPAVREEKPEVKPVVIEPQNTPEPKKEKEEKSLFWRIYGWISTLCIWVWLYLSLSCPQTLNSWFQEYHIWDYLPHESGSEIKLDAKEYFLFGIVIISIFFAVLKGALKILFWVGKHLFPKRDIREL